MHGIACTRAKEGHTAGTSAEPSACMRLAFHIPTLSEKVKKHTPKTHTPHMKNGNGITRSKKTN
nr:MAG TPA: hypothetical protein [Caudoviricetes sp.]